MKSLLFIIQLLSILLVTMAIQSVATYIHPTSVALNSHEWWSHMLFVLSGIVSTALLNRLGDDKS